ncbi:F0F1 ATP synthase subunit delta [Polycladomyces sp. WAk]|uniref:ATP synthase subunit delta n=1 Tax=Polycladomyces zharkentensis TaxID=2807616 RepID=A0ABS2WEU0_9BACL|nr:F0F1 ATP synthase subunit delta [Polycladomyces sp. WAk]MBN2908053.1 F0F1 ATP synthase subunit delta [Polycladomyces sp. WAk]
MSQSVVAKRYARALFEVATEKQLLDQVEQELFAVVRTLEENSEFQQWLAYPQVAKEEKKELLERIFGELSEPTKHLLFLLIDRGRQSAIGKIAEEFRALANESRGVADAVVTTPRKMTVKDQKRLIALFKKLIGKELSITNVVDSDILGGVIVRVGDRLYDGSLKTKLDRFQQQLSGTRMR